jgi:PKD repeat protein
MRIGQQSVRAELLSVLSFLLLWTQPAAAVVRCTYAGTDCNAGYAARATFDCISSSSLRILVTNTSTIDARDPGDNILSSLTFDGATPAPSANNRATVASGSVLLPTGRTDCSGVRNGNDLTCEWGAGSDYCANGPLCDGIDRSCRSPVAQCGLSFISSRQVSDVNCARGNFFLETGSIDASDNGADFGVIGTAQGQPEGGFERIMDTVELVLDVGQCEETPLFCDGVATFGPHFRHAAGTVETTTPTQPPAPTTTTTAFLASLSGLDEVPPTASNARGTAIATLNDNTLTYSVSSTGFDARFRSAHIHAGAAGTNGRIRVPLQCNSDGTACNGTSQPLNGAALTALLAGVTYVNLHTDAFPDGEIRGQLEPTSRFPGIAETRLKKFEGKAKPIGMSDSGLPRTTEVRISGRFKARTTLDLRASSALFTGIFDEVGGAGELFRGAAGEAVLPLPLRLARGNRRNEAIYKSIGGGTHPRCRLLVKSRGRGTYEFDFRCKRTDRASVPAPPLFCDRGRRPTTELLTSFIVNTGDFWGIENVNPWRCRKARQTVRELSSINTKLQKTNDRDTAGSDPDASGGNENAGRSGRPPRADFRVDPRRGNAPLTVKFTDRSSDADGAIVTRSWDFGDGTRSGLRNPSHTFETPGEFAVTLTVTDDQGEVSAPARQVVSVGANRPPAADFRAEPRRGNAPLTVSFSNRSTDPDGEIVVFGWTFGDGTGSVAEDPTHTFRRPGEHIVTLMVRDDQGTTSEPRRETISVRGSAPPGPDTNPPGGGGEPPADNRAPRADFTVDVRSGIAPLTVTFTNRSSDPDGSVTGFSWDFGDGTESTAADPTHTYEQAGRFTVTLTVTDNFGMSSEERRETINAGANRPPRADFRVDVRSGTAPLTVTFTNRSSDPDGSVTGFTWDFGDGAESTAANPTHTYEQAGRFVVTLVVTDDLGTTSDQQRETIDVGANRLPRADFRVDVRSGFAPLTVTFANRSSDPDGEIVAYQWEFGDGTSSTASDPTHTYAAPGRFEATLTVIDDRGATSEGAGREIIQVK